jgi:hypothetical protein
VGAVVAENEGDFRGADYQDLPRNYVSLARMATGFRTGRRPIMKGETHNEERPITKEFCCQSSLVHR